MGVGERADNLSLEFISHWESNGQHFMDGWCITMFYGRVKGRLMVRGVSQLRDCYTLTFAIPLLSVHTVRLHIPAALEISQGMFQVLFHRIESCAPWPGVAHLVFLCPIIKLEVNDTEDGKTIR